MHSFDQEQIQGLSYANIVKSSSSCEKIEKVDVDDDSNLNAQHYQIYFTQCSFPLIERQ